MLLLLLLPRERDGERAGLGGEANQNIHPLPARNNTRAPSSSQSPFCIALSGNQPGKLARS